MSGPSLLRFRIDYGQKARFINSQFLDRLNKEAGEYFKQVGIDAELLPSAMKGAGFDFTLWLKILLALHKVLRFLASMLPRMAARTLAKNTPRFSIYVNYIIEDYPLYEYSEKPGEVHGELVYCGAMLRSWLKKRYPEYEFSLETCLVYANYSHIVTSYVVTSRITDTNIGLLIRFMEPLKLKSNVHETVTYANSIFIRHTQSIFNHEDREIATRKSSYFKFDRIRNGSLRKRGIRVSISAKGVKSLEIVPRRKKLKSQKR